MKPLLLNLKNNMELTKFYLKMSTEKEVFWNLLGFTSKIIWNLLGSIKDGFYFKMGMELNTVNYIQRWVMCFKLY